MTTAAHMRGVRSRNRALMADLLMRSADPDNREQTERFLQALGRARKSQGIHAATWLDLTTSQLQVALLATETLIAIEICNHQLREVDTQRRTEALAN